MSPPAAGIVAPCNASSGPTATLARTWEQEAVRATRAIGTIEAFVLGGLHEMQRRTASDAREQLLALTDA